jgi:hypothetical protein
MPSNLPPDLAKIPITPSLPPFSISSPSTLTLPPSFILVSLFYLVIPNELLSKASLTKFKTRLKVGDLRPFLKQVGWSSSN